MTPQTHVMYAAVIKPDAAAHLRELLASMNLRPGIYDPANSLVQLHRLKQVHYARILVCSDLAAADRAVYGQSTSGLPDYLVLLAEIDGGEADFRRDLVAVAESGLRRLFLHCEGFTGSENLADYLGSVRVRAAAAYVNWRGRTVTQVDEEEALHRTLKGFLQSHSEIKQTPVQLHAVLVRHVREQIAQQALSLTPEAPTPLGWRIKNLLHLVTLPLVLLIAAPLLLLSLPFLLWQVRRWETHDTLVPQPLSLEHAAALSSIENFDVSNQFNVFGSMKPGRLRWMIVRGLLYVTDYAARHVFYRGNLARVSTIHFARWVPMDSSRMLFSSIYDGSLESYMDDFINKVGFGLNVTFGNAIGYPRTRWLVLDGCRDEQTFKRVLRRHQLATDVWYSAHPGLTAANKHRNTMIRAGLENPSMGESEARAWLALI